MARECLRFLHAARSLNSGVVCNVRAAWMASYWDWGRKVSRGGWLWAVVESARTGPAKQSARPSSTRMISVSLRSWVSFHLRLVWQGGQLTCLACQLIVNAGGVKALSCLSPALWDPR
jgi:hypothetical protein